MDAPDPIIVTPVFRDTVAALGGRLGPHRVVADRRWTVFADALARAGAASSVTTAAPGRTGAPGDAAAPVDVGAGTALLLVGPPAFVVGQVRVATHELGFVMPVARTARRWQRVRTWRDDATMLLWQAGWSIVDVDRLVVVDRIGAFEFAIGDARPTPTPNRGPTRPAEPSALDDGD